MLKYLGIMENVCFSPDFSDICILFFQKHVFGISFCTLHRISNIFFLMPKKIEMVGKITKKFVFVQLSRKSEKLSFRRNGANCLERIFNLFAALWHSLWWIVIIHWQKSLWYFLSDYLLFSSEAANASWNFISLEYFQKYIAY